MPRACSLCKHPKRRYIDKAYQTKSYRYIAEHYGVSLSAVARHKEHIAKALEKVDTSGAKSVYERFEVLYADAEKNYGDAEKSYDKLAWSRELRGYMELAYKLGIEARRKAQEEVFSDMTPAVQAIIDKEFE
jgi:transposase